MENSNNSHFGTQEINDLKTTINTLTSIIGNMQKEINELRRKVNEHSITDAVKNDIISRVSYDQNIKYDIIAEPKNVSQQNNIEVISQII
jgi:hypothetical protein